MLTLRDFLPVQDHQEAQEWANNLTIVNVDGTGLLYDKEANRYFDKKGVVSVSEGDRWDHPVKIYHDESATEEFRTAHPIAFAAVNERANRYDAPIEMHGEIEAPQAHEHMADRTSERASPSDMRDWAAKGKAEEEVLAQTTAISQHQQHAPKPR